MQRSVSASVAGAHVRMQKKHLDIFNENLKTIFHICSVIREIDGERERKEKVFVCAYTNVWTCAR